ncbi:MAG: hypothetical protein PHG16_09175 [Lachnospiraceae bacterium]|nr:hypothetical protein [Lachnospiraceae bacterium]
MAKIELAYSEEINDIVDAIEANELWMDGVLTDKKAFECIDEKCSAKITCRNMDTFAHSRKMMPHFIYASRDNMHSDMCEVYREFEEKEKETNKNETKNKAKHIGTKVCFHMIRPENHRNTMRTNTKIESEIKVTKAEARRKYLDTKERKSNYYWLNSMISYYVKSFVEKKTDIDSIEVDFGKGKKYIYKLNSFFKRISNEQEKTDKDKMNYVYYGKGILYSRDDGGYDIVYKEKFEDSDKK